ncbi:MAG: SsrA-binding protein SmpB [Planctomycetes bacterium]|nr:SsrA-binding protein SmpB [Planctomycetota bacterium]
MREFARGSGVKSSPPRVLSQVHLVWLAWPGRPWGTLEHYQRAEYKGSARANRSVTCTLSRRKNCGKGEARAYRGACFRGAKRLPVQAFCQGNGRALAKSNSKPEDPAHDNERLIAQNRRARHEYEVIDTLECGIVLVGSEVKSLRNGKVTIEEAYAQVKLGEVWLVGCDIPEYKEANQFNHEPRRQRKLLLHKHEFAKFAQKSTQQGMTLVPLKLYFKKGRAKLLLGLCRGRQLHDKREKMKKQDTQRDIDRAMRKK